MKSFTTTAKTLIPLPFNGMRNFCLVMIVDPDVQCRKIINPCKKESIPLLKPCIQTEGSLHFTLFHNQQLSYDQAMEISYNTVGETTHDHTNSEPCCVLPTMELNGFLSWNHCIAIGSDTNIDQLINNIQSTAIPKIETPTHLHMTLYNMNIDWTKAGAGRHKKRLMQEFKTLKQKVVDQCDDDSFGFARGHHLVLKEMGADYFGRDQNEGRFFRILC